MKKERRFRFKGVKFFTLVCISFVLLLFLNQNAGLAALQKSFSIIKILVPIFLIVILLMAVISYFAQEKSILGGLVKQRGAKGWFLSLFLGLLSHGPMYAWYPMLEDLRQKGLRDGYIATFFYARAVKLPLLPLMVDYFGLTFTIVLTLYIVIGSLIQGWLVEILE